jgi:hypothetical protein
MPGLGGRYYDYRASNRRNQSPLYDILSIMLVPSDRDRETQQPLRSKIVQLRQCGWTTLGDANDVFSIHGEKLGSDVTR